MFRTNPPQSGFSAAINASFFARFSGFYLFLSRNGLVHAFIKFVPDELAARVALGKAVLCTGTVLPCAAGQIGGDAAIECAVLAVRHDVDARRSHSGPRTGKTSVDAIILATATTPKVRRERPTHFALNALDSFASLAMTSADCGALQSYPFSASTIASPISPVEIVASPAAAISLVRSPCESTAEIAFSNRSACSASPNE
jgi:hypothetical protein